VYLTSAPFIVPSHEHDVAFAIVTVTPLIFLTVLLPEIPPALKARQLQYVTRGFTILFGFAAGVVSFLQLAGQSTRTGTIAGLVLIGMAAIFAALGMAWPILLEFAKSSLFALFAIAGGWLYVGLLVLFYFRRVKTTSDQISFWVFVNLSIFIILTVTIRIRLVQQASRNENPSQGG
jgi:hypothetical protein